MSHQPHSLQTEHDEIEALLAAATGPALETLQRQHGERLAHLKARLAPPAPAGPLSKKTT